MHGESRRHSSGGRCTHRHLVHFNAVGALKHKRLASHEVDDTTVQLFKADRQLRQRRVEAQLGVQIAHDLLGIGALAVELVDERESWDVVPFHLAVDRDCKAAASVHVITHGVTERAAHGPGNALD